VSEGTPLPLPTRHVGPVTLTDFVRYQGASGDMSPSHHDHEFARAQGHPSAIAPGLFSAGLLADYATSHFGPHNVRRFTVRFREQVFPGDELELRANVTGESTIDGEPIVEVALECRRGDTVVTTATAAFARSEQS
jgi:acyl dehydratase